MYMCMCCTEKERLIRYKFRWAEADEEPQDNQLTLQEFASFRHPEQSVSMLERMVAEIVDNLGQSISYGSGFTLNDCSLLLANISDCHMRNIQ